MSAVVVSAPQVTCSDGRLEVSSRVRVAGEEIELWFRGPQDAMVPLGADPFLVACLPSAMALGLPLIVEGDVSPRLKAAIDEAQDIYHCWYPALRKVRIEAAARNRRSSVHHEGAAVFFSGGVDSFYTTYKHLAEISTLVLVRGFDISRKNTVLGAQVSARLSAVAERMGKRLVEIETNSRDLTDRHVPWLEVQVGPALGSVALLLGGVAEKVFVAASASYAHLEPTGSHPLLDPLWSTEEIEIIHDGIEATRNEKVEAIVKYPEVLHSLRVCWENPGNQYNCGRCEKCIRTMINLETAGALERCTAFAARLDPDAVARMSITFDLAMFYAEENIRLLRTQNGSPALIRALETPIARYHGRRVASEIASVRLRHWRYVIRSLAGRVRRRYFGPHDPR
jgi:predicted PP-loop superfamily ATPase